MDAGFSPRYGKVRPSFPKKLNWKASFDAYLKWLLGPDQKIIFTFSNPALKSALWDLTDFVDESISSNLQFHQVIQFRIMAFEIYIINSYNWVCLKFWFVPWLEISQSYSHYRWVLNNASTELAGNALHTKLHFLPIQALDYLDM